MKPDDRAFLRRVARNLQTLARSIGRSEDGVIRASMGDSKPPSAVARDFAAGATRLVAIADADEPRGPRVEDPIITAARRITSLSEESIRDYEQGLCKFCDGGWENVPGPRGGKGEYKNTHRHEPGCPFASLREAIAQRDQEEART